LNIRKIQLLWLLCFASLLWKCVNVMRLHHQWYRQVVATPSGTLCEIRVLSYMRAIQKLKVWVSKWRELAAELPWSTACLEFHMVTILQNIRLTEDLRFSQGLLRTIQKNCSRSRLRKVDRNTKLVFQRKSGYGTLDHIKNIQFAQWFRIWGGKWNWQHWSLY